MTSPASRETLQAREKHRLFYEGWRDERCRWLILTWVPLSFVLTLFMTTIGGLSALQFVLTILVGLFGWTFAEYVLHRWVMHRTAWWAKLDKAMESLMPHRSHHRKPHDEEIAIIEKPLKPLLLGVIVSLYFWLYAPWPYAVTFVFGGGIGYVAYELVHFSTHKCRMDGPIGRYLKRQHMLHHFHDDTTNYGVTTPIWDFVFGTYHRPERHSAG